MNIIANKIDMKLNLNTEFWNWAYAIYYSVLTLVFFFEMQPNVSMSMTMRYVFFAAIFLPVLLRIKFFVPVFVFFMTASLHSFTPVLPTFSVFHLGLVVIALFISKNKKVNLLPFVVLVAFVLLDVFYGNNAEWSLWIFVVFLVSLLICDRNDINNAVVAFMLASVFLALLYIVNYEAFEWTRHTTEDDYSTSGWTNHNKYDSTLGCGALLAVATFFGFFLENRRNLLFKIIAAASVVLTVIVMLMDVSRGAIVSFCGGVFVLILMSKTKPKTKLITIVSLLIIVAVSLSFSSTDYLMSRFSEDNVATAGNRLEIWDVKFSLFFSDLDFRKLFFGIGWNDCRKLGVNISTHNDWITAFIAFGVVGLFLYMSLYLLLFRKTGLKNAAVLSVMAFLFLESMVVEPFFRGNAQMALLYIIALKYASVRKVSRQYTKGIKVSSINSF